MCDQDYKMDIYFRYYESQRAEIHTRVKERMSMAFQMLIMAATATVAYTQIKDADGLKIVLGLFVVALGIVGRILNKTQKRAIDAHIERARKARLNIEHIDSIAKSIKVGVSASEAKQYSYLHYLVMFYGGLLTVSVLLHKFT